MNRLMPLLLLGLLTVNRLAAQPCPEYAGLLKAGDYYRSDKKAKDYQKALNKYNAAKLCNPAKSPEVDKRIQELFTAIEVERQAAVDQRDLALRAIEQQKIAERQRMYAEAARHEALREAKQSANNAMALYWASESDKLESGQAVRLLLEAARLAPDSPPVYERLVKRLNADATVPGTLVRLRTNARMALFSSTGTRLLTAIDGVGDVAELWDLAQFWDMAQPYPKPLATFRHGEYLASVLFSPDDRYVLTTSLDGALLWSAADAGTPQPLARFGHVGWVRSARFSPDGRRLLTASDDSTARLWDVSARGTARPLVTFRHEEALTSAQFSPDGHRVLTVSPNATRLWEASGHPLARFKIRESPVKTGSKTAHFSPDGRTILTVSGDSTARLWDASVRGNATPLTNFPHAERVSAALFSPDGKRILTVSEKVGKLWDAHGSVESGPLAVLPSESSIRWAQFSPDGSNVLTVLFGGAQLWTDKTLSATFNHASYGGGPYPVNVALFSPDGNQVLTASASEPVKLWDTRNSGTPQPVDTFDKTSVVNSALFSPDGSKVLVASGREIRIWFTTVGAQQWARESHDHLPPLSDENRRKYGVPR